MHINYGLFLGLVTLAIAFLVSTLVLLHKLSRNKVKLQDISDALDDIAQGNISRKLLAKPGDPLAFLCYRINEITDAFRAQSTEFKRTEEANKQLMTSLSHDVRTPLTTLIGYLDAIQKGIVQGREREEYTETARLRAYDLKAYVDLLFEWFKLNSNDQIYTLQQVDLAELTRNMLKDWVALFEANALDFHIDIPDERIEVSLDSDAYLRILNNLLQNVVSHSQATQVSILLHKDEQSAVLTICDNGVGIDARDLPRIFERLYKSDKARTGKGSGLGLAIVQQLITGMGGRITAASTPHEQTVFTTYFPIS